MIADMDQLNALWVETEDFLQFFFQTVQTTITQPEIPLADIPSQEQTVPEMRNAHSVSTTALSAEHALEESVVTPVGASPHENSSETKVIEDRVTELINENYSLRQELELAYKKIDVLDHETRRTNLVFFGLGTKESRESSSQRDEILLCSEAVLRLCNHVLNFPIAASDISSAYRMHHFKSHSAHPPIIVRFCRKLIRDEVYRRGIMLEAYNKNKSTEERIFIHEDLTWRNQKIKKAARKAMNLGQLADTWTNDGYVFVKCNQGCVHLAEDMIDLSEMINGSYIHQSG